MSFPPRVNTSVVTLTHERGQGFTSWSSSVCWWCYICEVRRAEFIWWWKMQNKVHRCISHWKSVQARRRSQVIERIQTGTQLVSVYVIWTTDLIYLKLTAVLNWKQIEIVFSSNTFSNTYFMTYGMFHIAFCTIGYLCIYNAFFSQACILANNLFLFIYFLKILCLHWSKYKMVIKWDGISCLWLNKKIVIAVMSTTVCSSHNCC